MIGTHVDIEVGIVNIKPMDCLLEVDVGNTVRSNVMVTNKPELSLGRNTLHKRGGRADIVAGSEVKRRRGSSGGVDIVRRLLQPVRLQVGRPTAQALACLEGRRMSADSCRRAEQAQGNERTHLAKTPRGELRESNASGETGTRLRGPRPQVLPLILADAATLYSHARTDCARWRSLESHNCPFGHHKAHPKSAQRRWGLFGRASAIARYGRAPR